MNTPQNTVKTFMGLLGQQEVDRIDRCFLPGSEGLACWQQIRRGETAEMADRRHIFRALNLPIEITEIWQEEDRVGVTRVCNVTKELELKALNRRFITWDIYTMQVELQYTDGRWLIDRLWGE
jgi:hypothetical protein